MYTGDHISGINFWFTYRMSEHYAYSQIGSINAGWSDQIYTLTVSLLGQYMCSIFLLLYI